MGEVAAQNDVPNISISSVELPKDWSLDEREMCDLEMLLSGAFHPLRGYLTREEYNSVLHNMRLLSGEIWPMPIVLPIPRNSVAIKNIQENSTTSQNVQQIIKLRDKVGAIVAELYVEDIYEPDTTLEMMSVVGSTDLSHPHNKLLNGLRDCLYIGGSVREVTPIVHFDFEQFRLTPKEVKEYVKGNGWHNVIGFQTRNPMHRSHFELTRQAMRETSESSGKDSHLLLTPVVGPTQPGDVEYPVRVRCYKKIIEHYDNPDRVKLVLLPIAMRMAGPREAVWHALIRKNYGCTHFIVGRDHAGPSARKQDGSSFYGPYDAHKLLKSIESEIGILPVFGKNMVYVGEEHGGYIQEDRLPAGVKSQNISGTESRQMLENRQPVPEWFSFANVSEELQKFYKPLHERGFCVYFTGLPCSGKSTLAVALEAALQESPDQIRRVTVLDADVIRTHLSRGLGFSREDRQLNVRRVGYVASEIVKHGGICLVANIAPYEEDRECNRELITSSGGGYIEVFVSTPLEVCESRDIKELYKKARLGIIKQFTGISDPYEVPKSPELVIDSSENIAEKVQTVLAHLTHSKWII